MEGRLLPQGPPDPPRAVWRDPDKSRAGRNETIRKGRREESGLYEDYLAAGHRLLWPAIFPFFFIAISNIVSVPLYRRFVKIDIGKLAYST